MYDYLIVGAGLFGSVFAYEASKLGKNCLVIDKADHVAGQIFTEEIGGIHVHKYGAHIFHTSNKKIWDYINQFSEFNHFINSPIANYKGELYNLPFNMNTFYQLWGVTTPDEAKLKIKEQRLEAGIEKPTNLEEQAISLVGKDIYEKLIKGYTEKQWGRSAKDLPSFIIKRLPVRFTYNNNYFNDPYQGIPVDGYTRIIEKMLNNSEIQLGIDYFANRKELDSLATKVVFTGMIDQYYDYKFGVLNYRSLRFEHNFLEGVESYQGNAVVNYTDSDTPFTRVIEHKHFTFGNQNSTFITREYPSDWKIGDKPYYPINTLENEKIYTKYKELAKKEKNVIFGGRLATYKYYDMHQVINSALQVIRKEFN